MIRGLFYWIGGVLFTVLMAVLFYLSLPFFGVNPSLPHRYIRFWSKALVTFFCGTRIELSGAERIDPRGHYVIVSNHRSYMDILVTGAVFPIPFLWLAKRSLFRVPGIGLAMKIAGYIPVERELFFSASRSLNRARDALEYGTSVWVFPEGTRTAKSELGPFKRGAFLLAERSAKPILPVVIIGTDRIFPGPLRVRPSSVKVIILKPLKATGSRTRVVEEVRRLIQDEYDRTHGS